MESHKIKSVACRFRLFEELREPGDSLRIIYDATAGHRGSRTVRTPGIGDGWSADLCPFGRPEVVDCALKNENQLALTCDMIDVHKTYPVCDSGGRQHERLTRTKSALERCVCFESFAAAYLSGSLNPITVWPSVIEPVQETARDKLHQHDCAPLPRHRDLPGMPEHMGTKVPRLAPSAAAASDQSKENARSAASYAASGGELSV